MKTFITFTALVSFLAMASADSPSKALRGGGIPHQIQKKESTAVLRHHRQLADDWEEMLKIFCTSFSKKIPVIGSVISIIARRTTAAS